MEIKCTRRGQALQIDIRFSTLNGKSQKLTYLNAEIIPILWTDGKHKEQKETHPNSKLNDTVFSTKGNIFLVYWWNQVYVLIQDVNWKLFKL